MTKLKINQFNCPNCGGKSVFSPSKQKLECVYCGSLFDIPLNLKVSEKNLDELLNAGTNWNEAQVIECKNCSGKQIINNNSISCTCSFCGSTAVVKSEELPGLAPQGVVPFKVEQNKTLELSKQWAKSKFFAPNSFKKNLKPENISGVYYPVFTFDANTTSTYRGTLYETHTKFYTDSNGKRRTKTVRKYFDISGKHNQSFDDIIIQASNKINQQYISKLQPFPTNESVVYNPNFLNGYSALTYSKSGKDCWKNGFNTMQARIKSAVLSKYYHSGVSSYSQNTEVLSASYKYVLLPVYIGHFNYKNTLYNFYVNGYSGKVAGKTPISAFKVTLLVIFIVLLVVGFSLIFFLISNSFNDNIWEIYL